MRRPVTATIVTVATVTITARQAQRVVSHLTPAILTADTLEDIQALAIVRDALNLADTLMITQEGKESAI